jgi:DNA-damage-inducible protein D
MNLKEIKTQNLRDYMNEAELISSALAELSTRQITESIETSGLPENKAAGKKVVTGENYLSPKTAKKLDEK